MHKKKVKCRVKCYSHDPFPPICLMRWIMSHPHPLGWVWFKSFLTFLKNRKFQKAPDTHKHKELTLFKELVRPWIAPLLPIIPHWIWHWGIQLCIYCKMWTVSSSSKHSFIFPKIRRTCSNVICGTNSCWWVQGSDLTVHEVKVKYDVFGCFEVLM